MRSFPGRKAVNEKEKFYAIGRASANLVHELRKPLSVIVTCIQYCLAKIPMNEKLRERLELGT